MPAEVDFLVVGTGLPGLPAVRTPAIAARPGLPLGSGNPGEGASSRCGGMIGGGHRINADALIGCDVQDIAAAKALEMHIESVSVAMGIVETKPIDCDFKDGWRFLAHWLPTEYRAFVGHQHRTKRLSPIVAEVVPHSRTRDEIASEAYVAGAVFQHHGGLNPANWSRGA